MSFTTRIQTYAGATSEFYGSISQYLNDGVKDVLKRVHAIDSSLLEPFQQWQAVTAGGLSVNTYIDIMEVRASNGVNCHLVDNKNVVHALSSPSRWYCTSRFPGYYINNSKIYVIYNGAIGTGSVLGLVPGTVSNSAETITYLPDELIEQVILYSSARLLKDKIEKWGTDDSEDVVMMQALQGDLAQVQALYQQGFAIYGPTEATQ